jgi:hypothetical protein
MFIRQKELYKRQMMKLIKNPPMKGDKKIKKN